MSIIHEALKKVQSNRSESPSIINKPADNGKTFQKPTVFALLLWGSVIFILLGLTFYNLYEYTRRIKEMSATKFYVPVSSRSATTVSPLTTPAPALAPSVSTPEPKKGELILSGIVEMDGKSFALINKEFYEVGESVEGAKITKITPDSIEILQKGKTRTIKVLRPN